MWNKTGIQLVRSGHIWPTPYFKALILLILTLFSKAGKAQEIYGKSDIWFLILGKYELNNHWALGNEIHFRFDDALQDREQLIVRPFADFKMNNRVKFTIGYTYISTYPYSKYPLEAKKYEHNIWEQVTLSQNFGKLSTQHRYRFEHRFQSSYDSLRQIYNFQELSYANRFRYRITFKYPIGKSYFLSVFDELWVKSGDQFMNTSLDRNWIYFGVGKSLNNQFSMQLAYLHQNIRKSSDLYERHPTIQLALQMEIN